MALRKKRVEVVPTDGGVTETSTGTIRERGAQDEATRKHKVLRGFGRAGLALAGPVASVGVGLAAASVIGLHPVSLDVAPGIEATAQLQLTDASVAELGPLVIGKDGEGSYQSYMGVDIGVRVDVTGLEGGFGELKNIVPPNQSPEAYITNAVEDPLTRQLALGGAVGLATIGGLEFMRRSAKRYVRAHGTTIRDSVMDAKYNQELASKLVYHLPGDTRAHILNESLKDRLAQLEAHAGRYLLDCRRRKVGGAVVGLAVILGSSGLTYAQVAQLQPNFADRYYLKNIVADIAPLKPFVDDTPALHNVFIADVGGKMLESAASAATSYIEHVEHYWTTQGKKLDRQFETLRRQGKLTWEQDPNQSAFLQLTDIHSNLPYIDNYLPQLIKASGITTVVFSGDLYNGSNVASSIEDQTTKPMQHFEKVLRDANADGRDVRMIFVSGNHDPVVLPQQFLDLTLVGQDGKPYHPFIQLGASNHYMAIVDGVCYVGSSDINRTMTGQNPTVPHDPAAQFQNDLIQGELLAQVAKQADEETDGPVVEVVHETPGSFESLEDGHINLAVTGHGHVDRPLIAMRSTTGQPMYLSNIGSSSGDGPSANNPFPEFSVPTSPASAKIYVMDKTTGQLVETVAVHSHASGESDVDVEPIIPMPDAPLFSQSYVESKMKN